MTWVGLLSGIIMTSGIGIGFITARWFLTRPLRPQH